MAGCDLVVLLSQLLRIHRRGTHNNYEAIEQTTGKVQNHSLVVEKFQILYTYLTAAFS